LDCLHRCSQSIKTHLYTAFYAALKGPH